MVIEYLTAILAFITAIYVYLTHRMSQSSEAAVIALREQSESMSRPYITVTPFIQSHTSFLILRIKNTGKSSAENLKLSLDRDFYQFGQSDRSENNLRTLSAFAIPIDSFHPESELLFSLGQGWVIFGKDSDPNISPAQFEVTASYEFFGRTVKEVNNIDLRPYLGTTWNSDPIVKELERIGKAIEQRK